MAGKGGETAPGAMPGGVPVGDPMAGMGMDPQTMRQLMAMQFLSSAANNVGNVGALQRGGYPTRTAPQQQSSPLANILPMLQMQQMGEVGKERERKLAEQQAQAKAYYGPEDKRAGGAGTWVNPDTGLPQYTGMISKVAPELRPLLGSMDADKGTATLATLMAQQMKPKELPSAVQEYNFAKTPDGGGFTGTFEEYKKLGSQGASETFGNTPIWGKDKDGNTVLMQPSSRGGVRVAQVPEGVTPERGGAKTIDLGDKMGVLDANGNLIGYQPKGIKPEEDPDFKRKQAFATGMGKADAELQGESQKKALNALRTLDNLEGVESLIDKSTGSFGGAALDAMGAMFGHATEGAIASGKLKVLQAGLMTSMPRMEGPQSDRDVQLYREAAGQIGDPTVPNAIKKGAVETIRTLQQKYQASAMAPKINPPSDSGDGWGIRPVKN